MSKGLNVNAQPFLPSAGASPVELPPRGIEYSGAHAQFNSNNYQAFTAPCSVPAFHNPYQPSSFYTAMPVFPSPESEYYSVTFPVPSYSASFSKFPNRSVEYIRPNVNAGVRKPYNSTKKNRGGVNKGSCNYSVLKVLTKSSQSQDKSKTTVNKSIVKHEEATLPRAEPEAKKQIQQKRTEDVSIFNLEDEFPFLEPPSKPFQVPEPVKVEAVSSILKTVKILEASKNGNGDVSKDTEILSDKATDQLTKTKKKKRRSGKKKKKKLANNFSAEELLAERNKKFNPLPEDNPNSFALADEEFPDLSAPVQTLAKHSVKFAPTSKASVFKSKQQTVLTTTSLTSSLMKQEKVEPTESDNLLVSNVSSTLQLVKRGKEREKPKAKKPTLIKRIILHERMTKTGAAGAVVEPNQEQSEGQEASAAACSLCGQQQPEPAKSIHSRRFREYCDQMIGRTIQELATKILTDLYSFQTRAKAREPTKAKQKRRLVMGLREAMKHLGLNKIKMVFISPDLERIKSPGGLDDNVERLIGTCREKGVPYIFALKRRDMGRVLRKTVPVSVVAIFDYKGCDETVNKLFEIVGQAKEEYRTIKNMLETPASETSGTLMTLPIQSALGGQHSRNPSSVTVLSEATSEDLNAARRGTSIQPSTHSRQSSLGVVVINQPIEETDSSETS